MTIETRVRSPIRSQAHARLACNGTVRIHDHPRSRAQLPLKEQLERLEREHIEAALRAHDWHQANAAHSLGMPLRTFVNKLKRYNLRKP